MQKIIPFLWFDDQAEEAANFYVSCFENSGPGSLSRYNEDSARASGIPKGAVMTVSFRLEGQDFIALNGGPRFSFTPAISFFVKCRTPEEIDRLWKNLSAGGTVLMPLNKYPFSEKFGWTQDKYGVSWQLNLVPAEADSTAQKQKIVPFLMFVGDLAGKAEEAMNYYTSLFKDSQISMIAPYEAGDGDTVGTVKHAVFSLEGQDFMSMDSSLDHAFGFTPAISFMVNCQAQDEVDYFWDNLTSGGEPGQCAWLQDKYGVSWQIVPTALGELLGDPDPEKSRRVMKAMLQMKKIDIEALRKASGEA